MCLGSPSIPEPLPPLPRIQPPQRVSEAQLAARQGINRRVRRRQGVLSNIRTRSGGLESRANTTAKSLLGE